MVAGASTGDDMRNSRSENWMMIGLVSAVAIGLFALAVIYRRMHDEHQKELIREVIREFKQEEK